MNEGRRTLAYVAFALLASGAAWLTTPRKPQPAAFKEVGDAFFPDFQDPNSATTLEVVEFDEATAAARPFKVTNDKGRWTIPSHHNYPADGKERLAKTAAAVIGLKRDDFRTANVADHEACGVVDPLDTKSTSSKGRGQRVTIKGNADRVLADVIIGKPVPERAGFNFVRLPAEKRVYAAHLDAEISTKFEDWIERDLLLVDREAIDQVALEDYSIDERTHQVQARDRVLLTKKDGKWDLDRVDAGQEIDNAKVTTLLTSLDELNIVGVRPKPAGLSQTLQHIQGATQITPSDVASLQSRGYYFTPDGRLLSNEGELRIRTTEGVVYTLRFGEVVYGRSEAVSAGTAGSDDKGSGPGENRYLFITAGFDPRTIPAGATDEAARREKGEKAAARLNARFADWYYVISSASFDKVHLRRKDLMHKKV
jgi:hypothetical protein